MILDCVVLNAQSTYGYRMKTVVLDAGHGGHDTGCRGAFSNEKDVTLDIVLKVGALIKQTYPYIKVIYTRSTDEFIELYERADIANRNDADLFISIHCNASKSHDAFGTETWLMGLKKSDGNLEVSKRENDVVLLENDYQQHYEGFDPNSPMGYIILSMNQNAHLNQSIALASKVEAQFKDDGRISRGVKQAGFLVLWRTTMPSILIETGFLTNRNEEKYLNSESGQNEIAQAVLNSITNYKNETEGITEGQRKLTGVNPQAEDGSIIPAVVHSDPGGEKGNDSNNSNIKNTEFPHENTGSGAESSLPANTSGTYIPDPEQTASESKIIYRIQIAASSKPLDLKSPQFSSFQEVKNDRSETGINRYVIGNYFSREKCMNDLAFIRKKGFKDAFMVMYKFEKRVQ
ncbi:MAG: N-acetylmuramoyl-L-alanine amidase [Chitinophagales bacterium]